MIVTLFLAGLLPGAFFGNRIIHRINARLVLLISDGLIMLSLFSLISAITINTSGLPEAALLAIGTVISLLCGFQFPLASILENDDNKSISGAYTADLMGAATGILITSLVLIPYGGINGALIGLLIIKFSSMMVTKWKLHP